MIYVPRGVVDLLLWEYGNGTLRNPNICVKIPYMGFEISLAMDSSHGAGDLCRSDIRVFTLPGAGNIIGCDVSSQFYQGDENMLYGDADTLLRVMKQIEAMQ